MNAAVVVATYNERDNLAGLVAAILRNPGYRVIVVDDNSPDGTGQIADTLAAASPDRVLVIHRTGPRGLGRSLIEGIKRALADGADLIFEMDADWSHDPEVLPTLLGPVERDEADLVIGSRYTRGGGVVDWGLGRRIVIRGGSLFARIVLGLSPHDLTGGYKAWRASTLAAIPFDGVHAGGYVFQIEMTYRASLAGARIREVPITFRDRRVGLSKMSRRIILEALVVVCQLRIDAIVRRIRGRSAGR